MSWQIKAKNVIKVQVEANYRFYEMSFKAEKINWQRYQQMSPHTFESNNSYVTLEQFKGWFDKDDWDDLKLIDICGSYDELHPSRTFKNC